ncbi:hypothetical protein BsWGS_14502 [Bradybaena similaris]
MTGKVLGQRNILHPVLHSWDVPVVDSEASSMRLFQCQLACLIDTCRRCSTHIPTVLQHLRYCLRERSCVGTRLACDVSTARDLPSPEWEASQGSVPATVSQSPAGVPPGDKPRYRYPCRCADVCHVGSASSNPCPVHQDVQCPDSAHSSPSPGLSASPAVVCRPRFLALTSNMAPCSSLVLSFSTNSSLSRSHSIRYYRGQARSQTLQNNSRSHADVQEADRNIVDELKSNSECDSNSKSAHKLTAAASQPGDDVYLHDGQDAPEITMKPDTRNKLIPRKLADEMTLAELSRVSLNIVPYVKRSVTLQNLVRLGVSLHAVQKVPGVAEYLIKADFERNIVPQLKFLALVGVQASQVGHIFTKNPLLFLESVEDLELRVGYLVHKNFGLREVASLVTNAPIVLLMDPVMLDEKLAFLQNLFHLTDHQVREVVKSYPDLLPLKNKLLTDMRFHMREMMGFSSTEVQQLLLKCPRLFFYEKEQLVNRFDYLHNHMLISHQQLLTWPGVLRLSVLVLKGRHLFLLHKGRAQYDPHQENYVSLQALSVDSDEEFCRTVAKCDLCEFYNFCKTL